MSLTVYRLSRYRSLLQSISPVKKLYVMNVIPVERNACGCLQMINKYQFSNIWYIIKSTENIVEMEILHNHYFAISWVLIRKNEKIGGNNIDRPIVS